MPGAIASCSTGTRTASPTPTGVGAIKSLALRGLGLKLFLAIVLVVALVLGGALALIQLRANQAADAAIDRGLAATQSAIEDALAGRSQALQQVGRALAQVPTYIARIDEALRTGARDNIFDQAGEFRDQAGAAWVDHHRQERRGAGLHPFRDGLWRVAGWAAGGIGPGRRVGRGCLDRDDWRDGLALPGGLGAAGCPWGTRCRVR